MKLAAHWKLPAVPANAAWNQPIFYCRTAHTTDETDLLALRADSIERH